MSEQPNPGGWQASHGSRYPPEAEGAGSAAQANTEDASIETQLGASVASTAGGSPGGFVAFVGWLVMLAGFGVIISMLVKLGDEELFFEPDAGDYFIQLSPGLFVVGVGAAAIALGYIANRIGAARGS